LDYYVARICLHNWSPARPVLFINQNKCVSREAGRAPVSLSVSPSLSPSAFVYRGSLVFCQSWFLLGNLCFYSFLAVYGWLSSSFQDYGWGDSGAVALGSENFG